jgi:hypothetical protein
MTHPASASTDHNTPSPVQRRTPQRTPPTIGAQAPRPNGSNDNHGQSARRPAAKRALPLTRSAACRSYADRITNEVTTPPIHATTNSTTASTSSKLVVGSIEATTHPLTASIDQSTPSTVQRRVPHRTPATTGTQAPSPSGSNDKRSQRLRERGRRRPPPESASTS